jgi:WD40 repeat protein
MFLSNSWGKMDNSLPDSEENLALISASFDHTIILWAKQRNIWMNVNRFGQFAGNKNAFFQVAFSPNHDWILGYTLVGSFYLWQKISADKWVEQAFVGGHFRAVKDLDWSSHNTHLLTASHDQTSRVLFLSRFSFNLNRTGTRSLDRKFMVTTSTRPVSSHLEKNIPMSL